MKRNVDFILELPSQSIDVLNLGEGGNLLELLSEVGIDCSLRCDVYWDEPDDMEVLKDDT